MRFNATRPNNRCMFDRFTVLYCLLLLIAAGSCQKEVPQPVAPPVTTPVVEPPPPPPVPEDTATTYTVGGNVQKGPFLNGTTLSLAELDSALVPTGTTYTTQVLDNEGSYEFRGIDLKDKYVELRADGFYYDEVRGTILRLNSPCMRLRTFRRMINQTSTY